MKKETLVNHPPRVELPADNRPLVDPIHLSVKYTFDDIDEASRAFRGERSGYTYSRIGNPTLKQLEMTLAGLQGCEAGLLTASGVAAVTLTLLALCRKDDHVLLYAETYQPTRVAVRKLLARYGVRHTMLSVDDLHGTERVLSTEPTRLVIFESPTNPMLKIVDLERLTAVARAHGALTVLDNTFAGFHNHGRFPIDFYVHSLTKYASGHGDVMGGAVLGSKELINAMRPDFNTVGATLDPHAAYLIQRGLKTYFLRYERQCANALAVAQYLEGHPRVRRVRYPGLKSHPQHQLALHQMQDSGPMIACELDTDPAGAKQFVQALRYFLIAPSLGSTESLIVPPQHLVPRGLSTQEQQWTEITDHTVRLSVGIEAVTDLIEDLDQAFTTLKTR